MARVLDFAGWRIAVLGAVLALAMGPSAAQADPRDQVVVGVMHCAVITDPQQWLECFYGAAQPMRAYLNLPPAPQSQQQLLQRYYSPSPAGGAGAPTPAPGGQTASLAPPGSGPATMPRERGLFSNFFGGDPIVTDAPVRDYSFNPDGTFVMTLNDGQVWSQLAGDDKIHPVQWSGPASSLRVTVIPGALRTYNMVVNGDERTRYKVQRLR